jgi:hypothetical protein
VLVSNSPARTIFTPCCFQSKSLPLPAQRDDKEYPNTASDTQASYEVAPKSWTRRLVRPTTGTINSTRGQMSSSRKSYASYDSCPSIRFSSAFTAGVPANAVLRWRSSLIVGGTSECGIRATAVHCQVRCFGRTSQAPGRQADAYSRESEHHSDERNKIGFQENKRRSQTAGVANLPTRFAATGNRTFLSLRPQNEHRTRCYSAGS